MAKSWQRLTGCPCAYQKLIKMGFFRILGCPHTSSGKFYIWVKSTSIIQAQ
uniref:Uncharacterized protein n=1 Tax=Rhizophora mucronata TaxID=61149 RepID=A0A2P2NW02_RHIMU